MKWIKSLQQWRQINSKPWSWHYSLVIPAVRKSSGILPPIILDRRLEWREGEISFRDKEIEITQVRHVNARGKCFCDIKWLWYQNANICALPRRRLVGSASVWYASSFEFDSPLDRCQCHCGWTAPVRAVPLFPTRLYPDSPFIYMMSLG